jgi:type IV pilus assembly protein PilB
MNLLAILEEKKVVSPELKVKIEAYVVEKQVSYEAACIELGVASDDIRNAIGAYYDLPVRAILESQKIEPDVLKYLSEESASHYKIIPIVVESGVLIVGITDPDDLSFRDVLNFITAKDQLPYKLVCILESDFERGMHSYENLTGEVDQALDVYNTDEQNDELEQSLSKEPEKETDTIKEDAPVTKIVATVLRYAVDGGASDIHIEPWDKKTIVRFRVDGVLLRSLELPKKVHQAVIARIKILSSLRLDEKRKPQDGRFSATIDGRQIDFRVSLLPTSHGEKVVMRILDTEAGVRSLEDTGVSPHNIELIRAAIKKPYGIILISGPTGSGKSTTLYAMLSEIDRVGMNVISLEDPVEYNMEGVSQSQMRPEIGYTFANGLRTALRQDPDVVMVGEIRDKETAQLAIQAALTGHLVLSTIHTNNAAGVIPRLIDMGVDPYLIAPTLELALAQRLVRRICPDSGRAVKVQGSLKVMIDKEFEDLPTQYRSVIPESTDVLFVQPTADCSSGTKGRVAVMEAITINDEIERLILNDGTEEQILDAARKNGFISMKEDAIIKALKHTIPFEEVSTLGGAMLTSDEAEEEARQLETTPTEGEESANLDESDTDVESVPVSTPTANVDNQGVIEP